MKLVINLCLPDAFEAGDQITLKKKKGMTAIGYFDYEIRITKISIQSNTYYSALPVH